MDIVPNKVSLSLSLSGAFGMRNAKRGISPHTVLTQRLPVPQRRAAH